MPGLNQKPLLILFAFLLVFTGCNILGNERSDKNKKKDLSLYTIMVKEGTLPSLITSSGELQAERSLNVNPFRQGIIEEIYLSLIHI